MKEPTFAPMYASLFVTLSEIAREHGYALAPHGSLSTDFDLIAVPWTETAVTATVLVDKICAYVGDVFGANHNVLLPLTPESKPHGRLAWSIPIGCGAVIDLSVTPKCT